MVVEVQAPCCGPQCQPGKVTIQEQKAAVAIFSGPNTNVVCKKTNIAVKAAQDNVVDEKVEENWGEDASLRDSTGDRMR